MANNTTPASKPCTLLFLRRGDDILLAMKKRGFGVGRFNGVGGKVEPNESIEAAMIREAEEEIGITPQTFRKVAVHDFRSVDEDGAFVWGNITHTYICDEWQGEPIETEEMAPQWFNIADIPYHTMWQDDKLWLPLIIKGKLLRTAFSFDGQDNMLRSDVQIVADFNDEV